MKKIKLGLVPTKRLFLSLDAAAAIKQKFMRQISKICPDKVELISIDGLCPQGILADWHDAALVVSKMKDADIDALFFPFCDFGEEQAVAAVARHFDVPILIWGERDENPNTREKRGRDTQCGLFAATKVLSRMGKTFSYIYNVSSDDNQFLQGYETFLRVVSTVRSLENLRIARIGMRPEQFMSVIDSESSLSTQFGIDIIPVPLATVVKEAKHMIKCRSPEWIRTYEALLSQFEFDEKLNESIEKTAALKLAINQLMTEYNCQAAALACWSELPDLFGITPCLAVGSLTGEGYPISCEGDINGSVTSVLLQAAALDDSSTFFADLTIRNPQDDCSELLWHCGPFPVQLKNPDQKPLVEREAAGQWMLRKGPLTVARFDELNGKYCLTAFEGKAADGPETTDTYVWIKVDNWKTIEEQFIFGPYIHHVSGVYGHYVKVLREACRYIKGLDWDEVGNSPLSL